MRYAKILDSKVENVIVLLDEDLDQMPSDWELVKTETANVGDDYINGEFVTPVPPYVEPVVYIPIVISMRQARLQLLSMNLLDVVNAQISTMSQAAQIEWEYATEVQRSNPLVSALQAALSMTDSNMDTFFYNASLL
jgi:hypothetical protein